MDTAEHKKISQDTEASREWFTLSVIYRL